MSLVELALQGKQHGYKKMAEGIAARSHELSTAAARDRFTPFDNMEHRLEDLGKRNGVRFINDSKATNVNAAWYALECMLRPVIWIAGGVDRANDYTKLLALVKTKVKAIVCLGQDNTELRRAFGGHVPRMVETTTAHAAVQHSYAWSTPGDVVLLSPACASFDLFENYEHRGRSFKEAVNAL